MKGKNKLNNKKGFTLVELLAVIVILAIVATIGISTVLPSMAEARKNAFVTEVNSVLDAASNAMALIEIGTLDANNYKDYGSGRYCFSLTNLETLGLYKNAKGKTGIIYVENNSGAGNSSLGYSYYVGLTNGNYYIKQALNSNGNITSASYLDKGEAYIAGKFTDGDGGTGTNGATKMKNACPTTVPADSIWATVNAYN